MDDFIYGIRSKIGLIYPASAWVMEPEFYLMAPRGVATLTTRVATGIVNVDSMSNMSVNAMEAAKLLVEAPIDVIAFGCTSASFVNGKEYEDKLIKNIELETGVKSTSTSQSIIKALSALNVKKISVAMPYIEEVNQKAIKYMGENNIDVINYKGLGLNSDREIDRLDLETIYGLAKLVNRDESEAVVFLCTGVRTAPIIKMLEQDLNKPVITAIQATFWNSLRLSGINDEVYGFGKLLLL